MLDSVFRVLYIIGFIAGSVIRAVYTRGNRKSEIANDHETPLGKLLLSLVSWPGHHPAFLPAVILAGFCGLPPADMGCTAGGSSWGDNLCLRFVAALAFTRGPGTQLAASAANQGGTYAGNPGRLPSYPASHVRCTLLVGNCAGFTTAKLDCRLVHAGFFLPHLPVSRLA